MEEVYFSYEYFLDFIGKENFLREIVLEVTLAINSIKNIFHNHLIIEIKS